jgi:hypothetical protein
LDWNQTIAGLTYGDSAFSLSATPTGAGDLFFGSSDSSIIEINGTTKTIHQLDNDLIHYWKFDETSGTSASPTRGTHSGTLGSLATFVDGKFGKALNLPGTNGNSKVVFPVAAGNNGNKFTVSLWFKYAGTASAYGTILATKESWNDAFGWRFLKTNNDTNVQATGSSGAGLDKFASSSLVAGNWHHVAIAFNDDKAVIFADGVGSSQGTIAPVTTSALALTLGATPTNGYSRFTGMVDDFRIYGKALSNAEVTTLYGGGSGDFVTAKSGNVATIKKSGTVTLSAHAPGTNSMYGAASVSKSVTVSKAALTITAESKNKILNQANPALTYLETGYLGNDDRNNSITSAITLSTTAQTNSAAGSYPIVPSGGTSDKYFFNFINGALVISDKTPQTISWGQDFSSASINQFIDLNATSSSSLPVVFASSDESVASLAVTLQSSLDTWWKFDETTGTTLSDSSGQGSAVHNALLQGTDGSTNRVSGKFGNALLLDGTDDYGFSGGYKGITGTSRRTVSLWFKTSTANKPILQYGASGTGSLFKISINGSQAAVLDLGGVSITGGSSLADGNWHHFATSVPDGGNSGGVKLYVDGAATSGSGTTSINTSNANDIKIGTDGSTFFNGQLDDVRLYNAELNASMISKLYGSGMGDFNRLHIKTSGSVSVTASQPGDQTYAQAPSVTTNLTIGKSNQTISFSPIPDKSVGDFDFALSAVASSGLPVSFSSSDSLIAQVIGTAPNQTIQVRSAGSVTITASQAGDSAYHAATSMTQTLTIGYFNLQANSLPGIRLWLDGNNIDADTTVDSISNGSGVGFWKDRSGNNNHAGAVGAAIPSYTASGLNSKGVVNYSTAQTSTFSPDSNIRIIAAVIKQDTAQTASTKPFGGNQLLTTSGGKFGLGVMDSGTSSKDFSVVVWQMASGAYSIHVDGLEKGTGTSSLAPAAFDKVGNDFAGQIAEIVAYDRGLSSGVRQKVEGYLAHKWGMESKLPSAHAYKVGKPAFGGNQVLTFQPIPDKQAGQTVTLDVSSDSGLTAFTFDSNDTSVVSFSGNVATALKVGKVTITATQAGQTPWLPATAAQPFIVTATPRADQTITFADIPNQTVQSASFDLNASASSGLAVSFAVVSGSSATVASNGTVTIVGPGVTTIRASQDGNASYNPAPTVEKTLTINKVAQTITFNALSNAGLQSGTYSLSATASSGLSVSFTSSDPTVASVTGTTLTLKKGGSITITASQGGDSTYMAAPDVTQPLTVIDDTQQAQTITWTQTLGNRAFGVADLNLTATASSNLPITYLSSDSAVAQIVNAAGSATTNGTYLKVIGAGTATITATQAGNGQFQAATAITKSVTVTKANQEIVTQAGSSTVPNVTKDNGDFEFVPALKSRNTGTQADSGLALTYSSSNSGIIAVTSGGAKLTPKGRGTATITVSQAGDATYNAATNKTFTVTVSENSPYSDSLSGMILWLDANDINGDGLPETSADFISGGSSGVISNWADRSGSSNNLTQSSATQMPSYTVLAGRPSVSFDGTNDFLSKALPTALSGNPSFTILIAAKATSTSGRLMHFGSNAGTANQSLGLSAAGGFEYNAGSLSAYSNFNATPTTIGTFRRATGSSLNKGEFYRNGEKLSLSAINATGTLSLPSSASSLILGKGINSSGTNEVYSGKVNELIIFSGEITDYAIRRMEGYLAWKWGSQSNLVNGHPFKAARPGFGGTQSITLAHTNVPVDSSDNKPFVSIFDSPFELVGSYASSGLPLVYTSSNTSVLEVDANGLLKPKSNGNVTVTVSQPGDSHFSAATPKTLAMKVTGKRSQTITFDEIPSQQMGQHLDLNATSSANLPITFSIQSGSNIASISGTRVTFTGTGLVTVRAAQAGNGTYAAAAHVDRSFPVKRPVTLSFDNPSTKGANDVFKLNAIVLDGLTNNPIDPAIAPTPSYSILSGGNLITLLGNRVTCGSSSGTVKIRAVVSGAAFVTANKDATFDIDASKSGQTITFKQGEKGGLRDLPLSRKPIPLGLMAYTDAKDANNNRLPLSFTLTGNPNKVAKIVGTGPSAVLVLADGKATGGDKFSGFGGADFLEVTIKASRASDGSYHAAELERTIRIKAPSKSAFFEERKMDDRFDGKLTEFRNRMSAKGISGEKALALFDNDNYDSDGDGISNALERAFGGDSLSNDSRNTLPRPIKAKPSGEEDHEFITFLKYQDSYNNEGIQYLVETSRDLRTWLSTTDADGAEQHGSAVEVDGGMERVVYKTKKGRAEDGHNKIFIRVRIKTR